MGSFTPFDCEMMARAIALAKRGRFTTSPNPNVGCVIVQGQQIVGEGFHQKAGTPHAEVHALNMAGEKAAGATCYVTLEPCSHYGRTPPCALALKEAGVKRVVVAMEDPNPKVAGRGIAILRDAGIEVQIGLMASEAASLNPGFIQRMITGRPRVTLKLAASLDGRTALANGQSQWITSAAAREDVQRFRAQSCAILTGADTVLSDNPSLNVRWPQLGSVQAEYPLESLRQPARVIIDSKNRVTPDYQLFSLPGRVILAGLTARSGFPDEVTSLSLPPSASGQVDLQQLLLALGSEEINELWVEGGATLAGALLEAGLVDRLILYLAPKLMGCDGRALTGLSGLTQMEQVEQWLWQDIRQVGDDLRLILEAPDNR